LLGADPATVKEPELKKVQPELLEMFGGGYLMYHPGDNSILYSQEIDRGQLAHEFAHAVMWQSPDMNGESESIAQWVEQEV